MRWSVGHVTGPLLRPIYSAGQHGQKNVNHPGPSIPSSYVRYPQTQPIYRMNLDPPWCIHHVRPDSSISPQILEIDQIDRPFPVIILPFPCPCRRHPPTLLCVRVADLLLHPSS